MPSPETSRENLQKAKAAGKPPRPWRSDQESRVIRRLVWQWFMYRGPDKWSGRAVARCLGVSHTWIQKLVREFVTDPSKVLRQLGPVVRGYGMASISANGHLQLPYGRNPATFEQLRQAQEQTQRMRERGWLRSPRRWKTVKVKIGDNVTWATVPTKASENASAADNGFPRDALTWASPVWPTGPVIPRRFPRIPHRRRWRPGMPYPLR
jgi:hypothetical protein